MYSTQSANGLGGVTDGSGTINPAALNSQGMRKLLLSRDLGAYRRRDHIHGRLLECDALVMLSDQETKADYLPPGALTNPATILQDTSPRGIKRSRSPDTYGDLPPGDDLGDDGT